MIMHALVFEAFPTEIRLQIYCELLTCKDTLQPMEVDRAHLYPNISR